MISLQKFFETTDKVTCYACDTFMFRSKFEKGGFEHDYNTLCSHKIYYYNDMNGIDVVYTDQYGMIEYYFNLNNIPLDPQFDIEHYISAEDIETEKELLEKIQTIKFYR